MNVDEEDRLGRTRKRVSRACDRCRTRKDRCDGRRPSCGACVATAQVCTYEPSTKKRGLPEGYVRGMEKLWALSIERVDGLEEAVCELVASDRLPDVWSDERDPLHGKWKESKILAELESLLSATDGEAPSEAKRRRANSDANVAREATPVATGAEQPRFRCTRMTGPTTENGVVERRAELVEVSFPPLACQLLDSYFTFQHCWFPILERHKVLRSFYEYSKRSKPVAASDQAVLWALFAFTARQKQKTEIMPPQASSSETRAEIDSMQRRARARVPADDGPFAIGHVQALLLLTLLDMGNGSWSHAWHLVGFASRIALDLGLGSTSVEARGAAVMQGCFMLDTLVAHHLSRRPHLRQRDMRDFPPLDEDAAEEWEPWQGPGTDLDPGGEREPSFILSSFNRLRDLFLIINDVVAGDVPSGEARRFYFEDLYAQLIKLKPPDMVAGPAARTPPHRLYIRLFYYAVAIVLVRQSFDESGAPVDLLAQSACDVLTLLTDATQRGPDSDLVYAPPILEIVLRSACEAAIASKSAFGPSLLPYPIFAQQIMEHLLRLSDTWPCFGPLTDLWQSEVRPPSSSIGTSWAHQLSHNTSEASVDHLTPTSTFMPTHFDPSPQLPSSISTMIPPFYSGPTTAAMTLDASHPGDQVDAIFYNLAHLDTTEWTGSRTQGLLDFGFADELAFEAFCNDPERTLAPDARGTWWE